MDIIPIDSRKTLDNVLAGIEKRLRSGLENATGINGVEGVRAFILGNSGEVTMLRRGLGNAPLETRLEFAPIIAEKTAEFERLVAERLKQVL